MSVVALPLNGLAPDNELVAAHLQEHVDWLRDGSYGDVRNVVLLIETDNGQVLRRTCGQRIDRARVIGLLTLAAARAATSLEGDDEP